MNIVFRVRLAAPMALVLLGLVQGRAAADESLRFVALVDTAPGLPADLTARIGSAVHEWTKLGGPILRVPPEDVELAPKEARDCLANKECRSRLLSKGLAFVVFVDVVPSSDGLQAMHVQALGTVGGDVRLDAYYEFGGEGPEPHLRDLSPLLVRPPSGEVNIKVEPSGAALRLNGWRLPAGTLRLRHLVPGEYRLRADHDGRLSATSSFFVPLDEAAAPVVVEVLLPPLGGAGGDGKGRGKTWLYVGVGVGAVVAVLVGGIALAIGLAGRGVGCADAGLGCQTP